MSKNNKILKISLTLIMLSLIIVIMLIGKLRLEKPVFLINYCEIGTYEIGDKYSLGEERFKLKYISNVNDTRRVVRITFKEAPDIDFFATEYNRWSNVIGSIDENSNVNKYGRYGIHTVNVTCHSFNYEDYSEELVLSEATVEFDDGLKMDVDLGKIVLYKEKNNPVALEHFSAQTSDNIGSIAFTVNEDVKIEKIESPLIEEASKIFDFNIKLTPWGESKEKEYEEGTTIKKDSIIICSSNYKSSEDILENYKVYDIKPRIWFINDYNDRYSWRYYKMSNHYRKYTYYGLYKYLKARGEI